MEQMVSLAWAKGVFDGSGDGDGKEDWIGEWRVVGFHSLQFRTSLDRSVTDSKIHPHSPWHGFPPNVRQRAMRRLTRVSMATITLAMNEGSPAACISYQVRLKVIASHQERRLAVSNESWPKNILAAVEKLCRVYTIASTVGGIVIACLTALSKSLSYHPTPHFRF